MNFSYLLREPEEFKKDIYPMKNIWGNIYFQILSNQGKYHITFYLNTILKIFPVAKEQEQYMKELEQQKFNKMRSAKQVAVTFLQTLTEYPLNIQLKRRTPACIYLRPNNSLQFDRYQISLSGRSGNWKPSLSTQAGFPCLDEKFNTSTQLLNTIHNNLSYHLPEYYFKNFDVEQQTLAQKEFRVDHPQYLYLLFVKPNIKLSEVFA